MRILFTNWSMVGLGGSQLAVADLAARLGQRGHEVAVFSPNLGPLSTLLAEWGIAVFDRLDGTMPEPTIIHGHHGPVVAAALARFPHSPALYVCHGAWWFDTPPRHPRIVRWAAVDARCRDWLQGRIAPGSAIEIIPNRVDLQRFPPRAPLPAVPARALVFANQDAHIPAIAEACGRLGVDLDAVGSAVGRTVWDPGKLLAHYDIVFTSARKALEGLCVGNAVIVCDQRGLAGLASTKNFLEWRSNNFGERVLVRPVTAEAVMREMARYDPADALATSERARADADLALSIDRYEALYAQAVADYTTRRQEILEAEPAAFAQYLAHWLPDSVTGMAPAAAAVFAPDDRRSKETNDRVVRSLADPRGDPLQAVVPIRRSGS